ncbi:dynamin family protein [Thiobacillus sp.]|uniref:dynamin family protein n=1 Tax=Thiobacillus sp. TaxID=924 RepID=UPI0034277604
MQSTTLVDEFEHYSNWREAVYVRVEALRDWLDAQELSDAESEMRLNQLLGRLQEDKLNVAFVAEFSRGKSELINAIFFSDYRQRVLPSSAGRTTMCPTELFFDPLHRPSLRLLPIDTKTHEGSIADFKRNADAWTEFPLNLDSAEEMSATLMRLADTLDVDVTTAEAFGLVNPNDEETARSLERDGSIAIPRWRHALINFPHPLLKQGLVILDTPGLNAIGTEPELTLNMLPNAHAVLFLLAADTGVTKSDIEIWRQYIAPVQGASRARLVVLNKIDGLWDELKTEAQIDAEIAKQVASSAVLLGLPSSQVYPVSAQKALVAKIRNDDALLERSRLPGLEAALTQELIPCKQALVSESSQAAVEDVVIKTTELLETRLATIQDQVDELQGLRGKNRDVIQHMMVKANEDKQQFERGLEQFNGSLFPPGGWQPGCVGRDHQGNPRHDDGDVPEIQRRTRSGSGQPARSQPAQISQGNGTAGTHLRRALQHRVQDADGRPEPADRALFRDAGKQGGPGIRTGQQRNRIVAEGPDCTHGNPGARTQASTETSPGKRQPHPCRDRDAGRTHCRTGSLDRNRERPAGQLGTHQPAHRRCPGR